MEDLKGKEVTVIGGRGLIGSAVVKKLKGYGARVYVQEVNDTFDSQTKAVINCAYPGVNHLEFFIKCTNWYATKMRSLQVRGSIVNLSSIYGVVGPKDSVYENTAMSMPDKYAAAKAGIIGHSRCMATRFGKYGIRVNCISPGGVVDKQPEAFIQAYEKRVPMGRMAIPEDIASIAVFLASDMSSYITGQNIIVDGG